MGLLHRVMRKNSRSLVALLLRYAPQSVADELNSEYESLVECDGDFLFRLDVVGLADGSINQKQNGGVTAGFERGRTIQRSCRGFDRKLPFGIGNQSLVYKHAMLSMVGIAAICVCVALLFKSSPEVLFLFSHFRWEMLDYGSG
ncbi:squamosa promoter-binding 1 isoform X1 [Olea europaea subsp. europaea]|uniref:Squamosa promoter-binding 1 isoform X1 n=1 Tax=Olea europaea subsp. europaea TaxID=158383 RepID=A0A8S0RHJ5_OLEEU|nr:squamosa promoter-binding 1 isoform X1 [Olea europaea subsp. europaea]